MLAGKRCDAFPQRYTTLRYLTLARTRYEAVSEIAYYEPMGDRAS